MTPILAFLVGLFVGALIATLVYYLVTTCIAWLEDRVGEERQEP